MKTLQRTKTSFNLSIPTGLALETLFDPTHPVYDPDRVVPSRIQWAEYDHWWIHFGTLIRNMVSSVPKEEQQSTAWKDYAAALIEEIEIIEGLMQLTDPRIKIQWYISSYESLYTRKHHAVVQLRRDTTPNQKWFVGLLTELVRWAETSLDDRLLVFKDRPLPEQPTKSLILTHVPYDLLSWTSFSKLHLLESHTGTIKTRADWWTKYYPVPLGNLSVVPFMEMFLKVFGDHVLFKPLDIRFRRMILDVAVLRNWTSLTTREKCLYNLKHDLKEPFLYQLLLKL